MAVKKKAAASKVEEPKAAPQEEVKVEEPKAAPQEEVKVVEAPEASEQPAGEKDPTAPKVVKVLSGSYLVEPFQKIKILPGVPTPVELTNWVECQIECKILMVVE